MTEYIDDPFGQEAQIPVVAPSGATYYVLAEEERAYYEDVAARYMSDNQFVNISDVQDLDRVLMMELMVYRWSSWLSREEDYDGVAVDPEALNRAVKDYSTEIRQLKKALGIDKAQREKDKGESVADYIENLKVRAKKFGVMRNKQAAKSIELFKDLESLITFYDNCTEQERKENHVQADDIFEWLREHAIPEFNAIDEEFRKTEQQYWIREQ